MIPTCLVFTRRHASIAVGFPDRRLMTEVDTSVHDFYSDEALHNSCTTLSTAAVCVQQQAEARWPETASVASVVIHMDRVLLGVSSLA